MRQIAERIRQIIEEYKDRLNSISDVDFAAKPNANKWSKKEIVGHLIDSAQCNIGRFIAAQYEDAPFIMYNQDKWVAISNYQNYVVRDMLDLWTLLNKHICVILSNTDSESAQRKCRTTRQTPQTIAWLAEDYVKHLLHHLNQVCDLEPVDYP